MMRNPFTVLGITETDDDAAIKKAYLRQVREYPPERDSERFQAIRSAYDAIKTHRDRLHYRLFGQESPDMDTLMASALQPGPRQRPTEQQIRQILNSRATGPK